MNEQAEYMLLGSILKDNSIIGNLTITPEHFADITNQNLFRSMLNIKKKGYPIDAASIRDDMGEGGFTFLGGEMRLREYKDCVPSVNAFQSYEKMVINQWKLNTSRDLIQETLEGLTLDKLQELITSLSKVDEEGLQEEFNLSSHLTDLYNDVTVPVPKERSGIASGFADLDNKTDGFQENDLVIVGARPSMGKTAFLLNMAINAGKKGVIPVVFSLEMSAKSLIKRIMSCLGEINGMKLKNPYHYLNEKEKEIWINKIGEIEKLGLKIYDKPGQRVAEMKAKVRKIKHDNPDKKVIVFIDYLTLIKPTQNYHGNGHAAVTEISADLKGMAKEFKCPVVCLAQLSRSIESRDDKRPKMSDLRESGSIEQDADIIMMLYRDEYYKKENTPEENKRVLEVSVEKNRDGEVGLVKLRYKKEINKIENLYHYHKK